MKNQSEGGPEIINWKVGRDYVGTTHDHQAVFLSDWWGVIAGEGIHITYPLEDDMKGRDAEYTIVDNGSFLNYTYRVSSWKGNKDSCFFDSPKDVWN